MKLARYFAGGRVEIVDEPPPACPPGGLLVKTEACGLCSGELMDWYMDSKPQHVLGHEVCGKIVESDAAGFKAGHRVFAHHHAPCGECEHCRRGAPVHCSQWKRTKLVPGGMAEFFAAGPQNLPDTFEVGDLDARNAALIEPLGCVCKSMRRAGAPFKPNIRIAVVGLGAFGVMHLLALGAGVGYETREDRRANATALGLSAKSPKEAEKADVVFVCPGSEGALKFGLDIVELGGTVCLFAPLPPGSPVLLDLCDLYFRDVKLVTSYSCGPEDTRAAAKLLCNSQVRAEHVVSRFVSLDELPEAYGQMKRGEILKAMVLFPE